MVTAGLPLVVVNVTVPGPCPCKLGFATIDNVTVPLPVPVDGLTVNKVVIFEDTCHDVFDDTVTVFVAAVGPAVHVEIDTDSVGVVLLAA